jgi:predicted TIM-barrel fold metal-dependent hydrolase
MPPDRWADYLEVRYHDLLPGLHQEQKDYEFVNGLVFDRTQTQFDVFDPEGVYQAAKWRGLYDLDVRLEEMDREGVAGEFVNNGDGRVIGLFFEVGNKPQPPEICFAGVRAYHRWLYDTFGSRPDRLFLVGAVGTGPAADLDASLPELDWLADRGFHATTLPRFTRYPGEPAIVDAHWEPFWARCAERGLALWIHGGYGHEQGMLGNEVGSAVRQFEASDGDIEAFWQTLITSVFNGELLEAPFPRQAMWQLMLSGVFDRHPELVLVVNEARGDWIVPTLALLDRVWVARRDTIPAKRPPSEYWESNCHVCLSFIHRAEVPHRHEIGLERISIGRDYPHQEGTWPNTQEWLRDAFAGVPERELRMMLGDNAIMTFGLDKAALDAVAAGIGPTVASINAGATVAPALLQHFDARGGYLKEYEGDARLGEIAELVHADLRELRAPA